MVQHHQQKAANRRAHVMTDIDSSLDGAATAFAEGAQYTDPVQWHASAARIRAHDPVHWLEHENFNPFWIVSKHADVMDVERHSNVEFLASPRGILAPKAADAQRVAQGEHRIKSLVVMDGDEHKATRDLAASWFRPSNLRKIEGRLDELTAQAIAKLEAADGEIDFASEVAMEYPLQVILAMMGLPESDYPRMLKLTQELFGAEDPELGRDADNSFAGLEETIAEYFAYFTAITEDRKANPTDDFCSVVANAEFDGEPIGLMEQLGLYLIMATAGHDTTSHSMTGGLHALIEHPDQLARLQAEPDLLVTAVDEMVRWTSPVKHFMRTATCDYPLGGKTILAGQDVFLSYWSANFDDDVFENPRTFDVGRKPNKQIGFGFGAHYCLGAILAKMEISNLFAALAPRIKSIELADGGALSRSAFVSGYKHLPIRYELT